MNGEGRHIYADGTHDLYRCVYYLASLNTASDRVIYFILDLFLSLLVVR